MTDVVDQVAADLERLNRRHEAELAGVLERHACERAALVERLRDDTSEGMSGIQVKISPAETDVLERIEAKQLEVLNQLYFFRMRNAPSSAATERWVPLKEAARTIGKSERATWIRAQKIPDCSWSNGRRLVNLDLIEVTMVPPGSRRRE